MRRDLPNRLYGIFPFCVSLVIIARLRFKNRPASSAEANPPRRGSGRTGASLIFIAFMRFTVLSSVSLRCYTADNTNYGILRADVKSRKNGIAESGARAAPAPRLDPAR